jgi:hypothetical protein
VNALGLRPRSVRDISLRVAAGEQSFDPAVREFLDYFYANPAARANAVREAPVRLDDLRDAYLGAVAEHLARSYGIALPAWAETYGCDLRTPFFAGGLDGLKATLFVQSPTAFRRRMLFVSKDALSRPAAGPRRQSG